jgi:uncharacterized protein YdeI (YjbR/CyaY-like superfamily)
MLKAKHPTLTRSLHPMPAAVRARLNAARLMPAYKARPAYQQNDYLGWIKGAKMEATRRRRIDQMLAELKGGKLYMKMPWRGGT